MFANADAESILIGTIATAKDSDIFDACYEAGLESHHFANPLNQQLWRCASSIVFDDMKVPDPVLLADKMLGRGFSEYDLQAHAASRSTALDYADIIKELYSKRQVSDMCQNMTTALQEPDEQAADVVDRFTQSMQRVVSPAYAGASDSDLCDNIINTVYEAQSGKPSGITTGFRSLDFEVGRLMPGSYNLIKGTPGAYKTTTLRTMMLHQACEGLAVLVFALEQTREQMLAGLLGQLARVDVFRAMQWKTRVMRGALEEAKKKLMDLPIKIVDEPHSPSKLKATVAREMATQKRDVVYLDYLQRMGRDKGVAGMVEHVEMCSSTCADLAKTTGVPWVVVTSLSNEGKMRGSGQISYDGFTVTHLERVDPDNPNCNEVFACNEKNRFGAAYRRVKLARDEYGTMREVGPAPVDEESEDMGL